LVCNTSFCAATLLCIDLRVVLRLQVCVVPHAPPQPHVCTGAPRSCGHPSPWHPPASRFRGRSADSVSGEARGHAAATGQDSCFCCTPPAVAAICTTHSCSWTCLAAAGLASRPSRLEQWPLYTAGLAK
jgi:hypothetical protein